MGRLLELSGQVRAGTVQDLVPLVSGMCRVGGRSSEATMKLLTELLRSRTAPILVALAVMAFVLSGCGDAGGFGMAYLDANCNGVKDAEETPMAGVCVWTSTYASEPTPSREDCANEYLQTDSEGMGDAAFFSGVSCNDVYVFAQAPDGFQPTTDTVVNDCDGEFGFAREGTCPPHASVTPDRLMAYKGIRTLVWLVGGPAVVVLLAVGYRKFRRDALARHHTRAGD